ncbi:hypothetical protein [Olivibacter sp. XZL3]|uniref:hypothetical protein n=1 Tax=Olivibacter sp. XZL3 TaxID=1735116 RepID=UPI00106522D7|nr:hypothetical protein [Olivibacter sp. XZL3]
MEENDIVYRPSVLLDGNSVEASSQINSLNEGEKDTPKIYFFIFAILALLATNVYFYVKYKNSSEQQTTILSEKIQMETELDRIEVELDRVTRENVELTEALKTAQGNARTKIEELRAKLTQNELNRTELLDAQEEISELRGAVSRYTKDIEQLKSENALLLSERDRLKASVNTVTEKASELETINSELEQKVAIASALKLSSINVNAIKERKNGNESVESKAKHTDKLKIEFTIADNPLAKTAIYDVYIRVIEPNGNLLITENNIFAVDGVEMQYTDKAGIEFSNDGKFYTIEWKGVENFKPGTYTVVLYTNKGTMGKGTIRLI